jgi:4-amino-4-deoxy-L-arabinose transferase-like glycosyltransferase
MHRSAKVLRFPRPEFVAPTRRLWWEHPGVLFGLIFASILLLHSLLLRLPYFWDEAGYYIPAARDILLHFQLIPTSTVTNAHPPLVMLWLALWWKIFGYHILIARSAMLLIAAFALLGVYRLARQLASQEVAIASLIGTALFPVFFAQSTLAHLDVAAAAFTIWGVAAYLRDDYPSTTAWFAVAGLAKETAILTPMVLVLWAVLGIVLSRSKRKQWFAHRACLRRAVWLALSALPLALWFAYHHWHTGHIFGNPEFVRYNVVSTLRPVRFLAALAQRLWQLFGYLNMFVLTIVTLLAMTRKAPEGRPRIAIPTQLVFAVIVAAYAIVLSIVGGAVLARYLLPVYPLVIIIFVSTLWRRLPGWHWFFGVVCLSFVMATLINPPYHFAPEDNLAYADFVRLHQEAAQYLEQHPPAVRVLTAWPGSDELTRPYLGYVTKPLPIMSIENFSAPQIMAARDAANAYDTAFLFSTKYEPSGGFVIRLPFWKTLQKRYFDYHEDVPPTFAADMLQGHVAWQERRRGQWAAVLQMDRALNASITSRQNCASNPVLCSGISSCR